MSHQSMQSGSGRLALRILVVFSLTLALAACSPGALVEITQRFANGCLLVPPCDPPFPDKAVTDHKSWVAAGGTMYVAATAHAAGSNNTTWRSDLVLHAVGTTDAQVVVELLEHGADNSTPSQRSYTIPAGQCRALEDILGEDFQINGAAALRLSPTQGAVAATSRTFNLLGIGNPLGLPDGSTFGQFIPAVGPGQNIRHGTQARLVQLAQSQSNQTGFRTNLGLLNLTASDCVVETELFRANGQSLGIVTTALEPYEYRQINRVLRQVSAEEIEDAFAVLTTPTAGAAFLAYASVVDNRTGDPIAMMAQPTDPTGPVYVAASAHAGGVGGTNWRTDLEIFNPGATSVTFTIELLRHGRDNSSPTSVEQQIPAGQSRRFGDVLDTVFGFTGAAALRITPSTGSLQVTSRTYNLLGADNDLGLPEGSTFGQYIGGSSGFDGIGPDDQGSLIQMSEDERFRTNVNLLNTSESRTTVEIELKNSQGESLGVVNRSLEPFEYRQLNRIFGSVTASEVSNGFAIVRITEGEGPVHALASVVDNSTGDPVAVPAIAVRSTPTLGPEDVVEAAFDLMTMIPGESNLSIESVTNAVALGGVDGLLSALAWFAPGEVQVSDRVLTFAVGDGYVDRQGNQLAGGITVDLSAMHVTTSSISGTASYDAGTFRVNGKPLLVTEMEGTADLTIAEDRSLTGTLSLTSMSKDAGDNSMTGWVEFDTAACRNFPVAGSFTIIIDGESYTVVITPACDGSWGEGGDDMIVINFDDLDPDDVVSDQYPEATFSSGPGYQVEIMPFSWSSPPNCIWSVAQGATNGHLYVEFTDPVKDLTFIVFDAKPEGPFAQLQVFVDGQLADELPIYGTGDEDDLITVDLTAYSGVTGIACLNQYDDDTLLWDDFRFRLDN